MFTDDRVNEDEKKLEQLYDVYSKLGLASAVIGTPVTSISDHGIKRRPNYPPLMDMAQYPR